MNESENLSIAHAPLIETARNYCVALEHAADADVPGFVDEMTRLLPQLYLGFSAVDASMLRLEVGDEAFLPEYIDEEYYDAVRRGVEQLLGADDTYLETFEEDMKYSDTPIGASVAEGLADIFQALYNFVCAVKESDGGQLPLALAVCREAFESYWAQTLCNVMRPLNHLKYN